jgi:multiple sugar transport system permease protein
MLERISGGDFRRLEAIFGWLMGAPAFLGIAMFIILPFLVAIGISFTDSRLVSPNPPEFIGIENYSRLLGFTLLTLEPVVDEETGQLLLDDEGNLQFPRSRSILRTQEAYQGFFEWFTVDAFGQRYVIAAKDPVFMTSLINNLKFTLVVVPVQSGLALVMALLVNQRLAGVHFFRTTYFSPVVTSMAVLAVVWKILYNPQAGLINQLLAFISAGLLGPFDWLGSTKTALLAIIILSVWQGAGFQMVIFLAGLQGVPEVLYEAASIDGANARQRFRHVTLPGLRNTMIFVIMITTIFSFRLFTQVDVMTQGGPRDSATSTVVFHAIEKGFRAGDLGYGAAISVVFFLIVLVIALVQRRVLPSEGQE